MPKQAKDLSSQSNDAAVHFTPIDGRRILRLKCWLPEHVSGIKPVMLAGQDLPSRVGDIAAWPARVLCVAPGEWLVSSADSALLQTLFQPQSSQVGVVLDDLSEGLLVFEMSGCFMRELLSKGCGLDFNPRHFEVNHCARTRFANISVIIDCIGDQHRFELYVARSHGNYLEAWLADAATEFLDRAARHATFS